MSQLSVLPPRGLAGRPRCRVPDEAAASRFIIRSGSAWPCSPVAVRDSIIKVERMVAAADVGVAVNPDIVKAQIEGAIGFALSIVLRNQITLKRGLVQQSNFDDYEPARMREMPKVEVYLVSSLESPSGIGEPGVPPVAPAIGNAVAAATGKRLYTLPLGYQTELG